MRVLFKRKNASFPRRPFAALPIPLDIKRQYSEDELRQVNVAIFETSEDGLAVVYIEFDNGFYDEWSHPIQNDYAWQSWGGWAKTNSGELEDE